MTLPRIIILCLIVAAVSAAIGRYTAPVKVVTETKTVEVEKKTKETESNKIKHTITKEVVNPDGSKTKETEITEETNRQTKSQEDKQASTDTKTETTRGSSKTTISVLGSGKLSTFPQLTITPGLMVTRDLLGPINIGIFGFTNGVAGVSLGLSF